MGKTEILVLYWHGIFHACLNSQTLPLNTTYTASNSLI